MTNKRVPSNPGGASAGRHTPGPWRYEPASGTIRSMPGNHWLATMDSWDGAVCNAMNGRLIAAAPELLEACQAMLEHYGPPITIADRCEYPNDHPISKARAAIAKATSHE